MSWIPQRLDARQVMATGQGQIAAETMRPGFADEAVLAPEFFALVSADSGDQGYGESGSNRIGLTRRAVLSSRLRSGRRKGVRTSGSRS